MESAGLVVLALILREGIPALVRLFPALDRFLKGRQESIRELAADERRERREDDASDRRAEAVAVRELKELIVVQRADISEYRQQRHADRTEMQAMFNKLSLCEQHHARAEERIAALEDALTKNEIPFHRRGSGPAAPAG